MTEHTVLIDFDPWSEVSHHAHLVQRHMRAIEHNTEGQARASRELTRSVSAQTRALMGSNERLEVVQTQTNRALAQLPERFDRLEHGLGEIVHAQRAMAVAIAWGFGRLSRDIVNLKSEVSAKLDTLIDLQRAKAYEKFEIAKTNYRKGLYEEARDRVKEAIDGTPFHEGYKEEFWFHYLLGDIQLGSWAGDKPNIDEKVVDAGLAEKAFLTATRYAENEKDRAEAFYCAGRSAFVQRELARAIEHTEQAINGHKRPADVHYQLAKCQAGLPDSVGREEAGKHLRTALELNFDLLLHVWEEEAYFNRVGALEVALLQAAPEFRARARTETDNYRLAGCFATFPNGRAEAVHHLWAAVDRKLDLFHDACADEVRLNRGGVLHEVMQRKAMEFRAKLQRELDHFERVFQFIRTVEHRGFSPSGLLERELLTLKDAAATARNKAAKGGIFDLDAALAVLAAKRVDLDGLQSNYLTRLEQTLREKWQSTEAVRRADDAQKDMDRCKQELSRASAAFDQVKNLQLVDLEMRSLHWGCLVPLVPFSLYCLVATLIALVTNWPLGIMNGIILAICLAVLVERISFNPGALSYDSCANRAEKTQRAFDRAKATETERRAEAEKLWQAELEIVKAARQLPWPERAVAA